MKNTIFAAILAGLILSTAMPCQAKVGFPAYDIPLENRIEAAGFILVGGTLCCCGIGLGSMYLCMALGPKEFNKQLKKDFEDLELFGTVYNGDRSLLNRLGHGAVGVGVLAASSVILMKIVDRVGKELYSV